MVEFPLWLPKNGYRFALRFGVVYAKAAVALTGGFAQIEEDAVMGGEQKKSAPRLVLPGCNPSLVNRRGEEPQSQENGSSSIAVRGEYFRHSGHCFQHIFWTESKYM
jgi:hypothetical protein